MPKLRHSLIPLCAALMLGACMPGAAPETDDAVPQAADRDVFLTLIASIADGGKPQAALAYLEDYLSRYPGDERALLLKANCLAGTDHPEDAKRIYEGLTSGAAMPDALAGLGRVAAGEGDWPQAADSFARAYGHMPSNAGLLNDYGYALLMTNRSGEAFTVLARAHELKPDDTLIRNNFLLAAKALGRARDIDSTLAPLSLQDRQRLLAFIENWSPRS